MKESNYNQIIMSKEFETLDQTLMVEIIRRKTQPQNRGLPDHHKDTTACKILLHAFVVPASVAQLDGYPTGD